MEKKIKIYISGPVTGTTDYLERFAEIEKRLKDVGFSPLNPVKIQEQMPGDTGYVDYMRLSMCLLEMCDGIFMMDGWEDSDGATAEYSYARALGLDHYYEGEDGMFYKGWWS